MSDAPTTHPTAQQLANYSLGKLPAAELATVHAHVAGCAECRQKVENQPPDSFIGQLRAGAPRGASMLPTVPPSPSSTSLPVRQPAEARADDVPPELLASSKFEILGKLGQGGMGAVYKARHAFLGELVAIKVMSAAVVENPEARSRFLREMKATGKLKHPNIVRALDAEQIGDLLILVVEYIAGITLDRLVKQRGPLPVDFACQCIVQAATGLQHAHEMGMVHRDIKPANLIVTPKEKEVKLLDFGLVRGSSVQTGTRQTKLQTFMGTPEYVAPEQAGDARNADIRADVYSLGCTLYFLLAGRPPFKSDSIMGTIMAQVQDEAQPLPELRAEVPAGLWAVVAKMIAKNPGHRYQTPIEVAQALKPFVVGGEARRADARPVEASAAINRGQPPAGIPPVRAMPKAEESLFALAPAPPQSRREKAKEKSKRPAWMVPAAVACGLATIALLSLVVLTFRTGKGKGVVKNDQPGAQMFVDASMQEKKLAPKEEPKGVAAVKDDDKGLKENKIDERAEEERRRLEVERKKLSEERAKLEFEGRKREYGWAMKEAQTALDKGQHADAEKGFTEALRLMPGDAEAAKGLKAATTGLAAAKKTGEEVDRLLADSKKAMTDKQYAVAVQLLTKAKEIAPANRSVLDALVEAQKALDADVAARPLAGKEITNSIGMKLVRIEPSTFKMGSPIGAVNSDEKPQHEVEITKPFFMGVYAVTQAEYKEVMGENPSWFKADGGGKDLVKGLDTSTFPVETVSWEDAVKFCAKLSMLEKEKDAGRKYRLPTEAEWEYACRAGTKTTYHSGDIEDDLKQVGWYQTNSGGRTHEVGTKKANAWGLYDMHGNVYQWCNDRHGADYYGKSPRLDPPGPSEGSNRVIRGGCWFLIGQFCRSAYRAGFTHTPWGGNKVGVAGWGVVP